jgi:hypothetical protein
MTVRDRKLEFLNLMKQKQGIYYTLGWLESAYAYGSTEDQEIQMIEQQMPKLESLPNYNGI